MSTLYSVIKPVAPAFMLIFLGFALRKTVRADTDILIQLSMRLLVPSFAFTHLYQMEIDAKVLSQVFLSAWIIMLIPGILAWCVFRGKVDRAFYLPIFFMNSANLPFPILLVAYGDGALPHALIFFLASLVAIFTLGILVASGGEGKGWSLFREPVLYAIGIAFYMNTNGVVLPDTLTPAISMLESATIPIVLLILGIQLAEVKTFQWKLPIYAVSFRFIGGLSAGLFCAWLFSLEGLVKKVVIIEALMPSAIVTSLLAEKFNADSKLAASSIFLSTVLSLIIIPLTLFLLG